MSWNKQSLKKHYQRHSKHPQRTADKLQGEYYDEGYDHDPMWDHYDCGPPCCPRMNITMDEVRIGFMLNLLAKIMNSKEISRLVRYWW